MIYEYMRGNGTGQAKNETLYTYDALNRLVTAHDNYGNSTRTYTYDSLGNLTYETGIGSHNCDYIYNNLNQQVDRSSDNWKSHTASTYDKRGNLVLEEYGKNKKLTTAGAYTFDETNKMVRGVNGNAEESIYTYNGLGALMEQTWIIAKNGYGYHDVSAVETPEDPAPEVPDPGENPDPEVPDPGETPEQPDPGINNEGNGNNNGNSGNGNGNQDKPTGSDVKKTSTVVKQFVVDFSSETYKPLMEHEVNGLDYHYVYSDKARLSVVVQGIENGSASLLDDAGELHAYYHCDYLGTTDYLTSAVNSKVISWTSYSEWGEITHNAVLKCGQRELDLVKEYATHDFDAVLNMYYAKARFYDADNRRFAAVDPILDPSQYDLREYVTDPMQLVQYLYVRDNAIILIDPLGESAEDVTRNLARWIIANPAAVAITQDPGSIGEKVFYAAGFVRDNNGIYHTRQDALQRFGGYNSLYDVVFDYATSMKAQPFEFTYNGQDYRLWAWKGDYLNLGAGAELGIYSRLTIDEVETPHWLVDTDLALPMTMELRNNEGELIASYSPDEPQWWITSFNPYYQKVQACTLTATYTVDFSNSKGMYRAFINSSSFTRDKRWTKSKTDPYTVILTF